VSSILNRNCVACHKSTQDSPHLDLGHFQALSDGSFGFPHLADNGDVISSGTTFRQIEQRLSSADPKTRMPYLSDMPSQDRQALFVWVSGEGSK
jgi:mono/diheme cytochrome c family protein